MEYRNLREGMSLIMGEITLTYMVRNERETPSNYTNRLPKTTFALHLERKLSPGVKKDEKEKGFILCVDGQRPVDGLRERGISLKLGRSFMIEYPRTPPQRGLYPERREETGLGYWQRTYYGGSSHGSIRTRERPLFEPCIQIHVSIVRTNEYGSAQFAIRSPVEIKGGTVAHDQPNGNLWDRGEREMLQMVLESSYQSPAGGLQMGLGGWHAHKKKHRPRAQKIKPSMSWHMEY